jgi:hypothetical protein
MSPHYDRHTAVSSSRVAERDLRGGSGSDAMENAAEALRHAELEAVQPAVSAVDRSQLENMSIDELRKLATALDVPNRGAITVRDELLAAIRQRL